MGIRTQLMIWSLSFKNLALPTKWESGILPPNSILLGLASIVIILYDHNTTQAYYYLRYFLRSVAVPLASTALCRVAPWCSRRTASFHPPLGILTSVQNLGNSWFSLPSIDLHSNMTTSGGRPPTYQRSCSMNCHVVQPMKGSDNVSSTESISYS